MARQEDTILWKLLDGSPTEWAWFIKDLAIVVFALWVFTRFVAWMRDDEDTAAAEHMMLTDLSELHRDGDLSDEEYRSIKGRLLERMDESDNFPRPPISEDEPVSEDEESQEEKSD